MKTYLVTAEQHDGEHEHILHLVIQARDFAHLERIEKKLFRHDDCGLDRRDSSFGYGDGLTATRPKGAQEITAAEAETLTRLGCAYRR